LSESGFSGLKDLHDFDSKKSGKQHSATNQNHVNPLILRILIQTKSGVRT
jgi:hypothetical protein